MEANMARDPHAAQLNQPFCDAYVPSNLEHKNDA